MPFARVAVRFWLLPILAFLLGYGATVLVSIVNGGATPFLQMGAFFVGVLASTFGMIAHVFLAISEVSRGPLRENDKRRLEQAVDGLARWLPVQPEAIQRRFITHFATSLRHESSRLARRRDRSTSAFFEHLAESLDVTVDVSATLRSELEAGSKRNPTPNLAMVAPMLDRAQRKSIL